MCLKKKTQGYKCNCLSRFKGVADFNYALAINPKLFQAYLGRACFFGMTDRVSKAILNCNEALHIQPDSVRAYIGEEGS